MPAVFAAGIDLATAHALANKHELGPFVYGGPKTSGEARLFIKPGKLATIGAFTPDAVVSGLSSSLGYQVNFDYRAQGWVESMIEQAHGA